MSKLFATAIRMGVAALCLSIVHTRANASALLFSSVTEGLDGLYTYNYAVENNSSSTIWNVDILVGGLQPILPSYTAPSGWTMYGAFSGSIANQPYNESGGFYEWYGDSADIQPGATAFGFSLITSFAPTLDSGLNDFFLYGSEGVVAFGNVVVPDGASWYSPPSPIAAAVPEPSTWAMLLLGFAGFGAMAYRRRSLPRYEVSIHAVSIR